MGYPLFAYSGPGKTVFNGLPLQATDANGAINAVIEPKTTKRGTAMYGEIMETLDEPIGKVSLTPFDDWSLLDTFFPPYLGVTTTANAAATVKGGGGVLKIGQRPHDYYANAVNGLVSTKVWRFDGGLYNFVRCCLTKPPEMRLGVGQKLFGPVEFTALGDIAKNIGDMSYLLANNGITEGTQTGGNAPAADPDVVGFSLTNFINGRWTIANTAGSWGALLSFGGAEADEGFMLVPEVKYDALPSMKRTGHMKLASARFMIKGRLVGALHSDLASKNLSIVAGGILQEANSQAVPVPLILNGPSNKTITLANVEVKGAPFEFGGAKLGTGEVAFVSSLTYGNGNPYPPAPSLIFSA